MLKLPLEMRTQRTIMRKISLSDAQGWKLFNNQIARRMEQEGLHWPQVPSVVYARNEILHYLKLWEKGTEYVYTILAAGKVIGDFHLKGIDHARKRVQFGHALAPSTWGTGITYETLDEIKNAVMAQGYVLWAQVEEENMRSWRSLEKYKAKFKGVRTATIAGVKKRVRVYEL